MAASPRSTRYPYRAVEALEDVTAMQERVVAELAELRQAATHPTTKRYLREQERNARAVLDWLATLRAEMRHGPP